MKIPSEYLGKVVCVKARYNDNWAVSYRVLIGGIESDRGEYSYINGAFKLWRKNKGYSEVNACGLWYTKEIVKIRLAKRQKL